MTEKPSAPLRIFLSYGHDSNEELVRQIKVDLEKRGHDVWFDKSNIKAGDDWRRAITEGIVNSDQFLSFLSKYSTRDPGVCLDEIAIALGVKGGHIQTILVESEQDVRPPPTISHIQWLDMHDWKERRDAGEASWKPWYREKTTEILRIVESDESRRFAGEIEALEGYLKPISSDSRIFQLLNKGFVGRAWLVAAVEQWRNDAARASRLFWIMGAPGVGKSAFAAHLAHYGRDKVIGVHFCEYDKPDHRNADRIVRTLAFQIATRLPDYRKLLLTLPEIGKLDGKKGGELFDYLLANPLNLSITGGRERYILIIDALDEAGDEGRNELVEMLAPNVSRLPEWIGIIVTSRPEGNVVAPLQGLNPVVLNTETESNRADIRDYLRANLAAHLQSRSNANRLVDLILEKSEGVFLYAARFCEDTQRGQLSLDHPDQFPQGLGGIFFQYFKRQFPDLEKFRKDVRPGIRAILAAREPLPVEILQLLFNWEGDELRDFTRSLGSIFPVMPEAPHEVIKPYHKSLDDWLTDESKAGPYFVSVMEGHQILTQCGYSRLSNPNIVVTLQGIDGFWARCLLYNCVKSRNWDILIKCIADPVLFWKLSPSSYAHKYQGGDFFGFFSAGKFFTEVMALLQDELKATVCWSLANVLGERTKDFQSRVQAVEKKFQSRRFAHAEKHGERPSTIRDYLEQHAPAEFYRLRDTIYSFARIAGITAEFACAATSDGLHRQYDIRLFLQRFASVHGYLHYLSDNASGNEGWSGALESEAYSSYLPWKQLIELADS
jgi:hypothetical protein